MIHASFWHISPYTQMTRTEWRSTLMTSDDKTAMTAMRRMEKVRKKEKNACYWLLARRTFQNVAVAWHQIARFQFPPSKLIHLQSNQSSTAQPDMRMYCSRTRHLVLSHRHVTEADVFERMNPNIPSMGRIFGVGVGGQIHWLPHVDLPSGLAWFTGKALRRGGRNPMQTSFHNPATTCRLQLPPSPPQPQRKACRRPVGSLNRENIAVLSFWFVKLFFCIWPTSVTCEPTYPLELCLGLKYSTVSLRVKSPTIKSQTNQNPGCVCVCLFARS